MAATLMDKKTAETLGLQRYYTGKVCLNGHIAERYVNDGRCVECKAAKSRRYYERYPEQQKERTLRHFYATHDAQLQYRREYHIRKKTDEAYQEKKRNYMAEKYDYFSELRRKREATPEAKAAKAAKRKNQAHLYRSYEQKRRARLKNAVPRWYGEFDDFVMTECTSLCDLRLAATGFEWQLDHMIPLLARRATGLHCALNVQVIPMWMNRKKNNRMLLTAPLEWLAAL